jgi:hypothetical protein
MTDGRTIAKVADTANLFSSLAPEQKQLVHWRVAIRMFGHAVKESACLRVATISLKNAPSYEGTLNAARSPDPA